MSADDDDMEPLDARSNAVLPPPTTAASMTAESTTVVPSTAAAPLTTAVPSASAARSTAGGPASMTVPLIKAAPFAWESTVAPDQTAERKLRMHPWRVLGASAVAIAFALSGWQVQRAIDEQPRIDAITWWTILAGVVAAIAVLTWTWVSTENARRLVSPASTHELPNPARAVSTWILPFAFIATSAFVVTYLSRQPASDSADSTSSVPLAIAVVSVLLAIPLTYRPVHYMAGIVRQIGGYSAKLAQWMWVPVVLALVGVASILLIRFGGAVETTSDEWAPLWVIAVVAIAPCIVVVLLAWRAAESVEEAIAFAFTRRGGAGATEPGQAVAVSTSSPTAVQVRSTVDARRRVRQMPGTDVLRILIVTLLAGLALLSVIGAIVMFLFWQESNDGDLLPVQIERAWDTIAGLHNAERVVAFVLVGATSLWTFVAVLNVRMASGRRRNPIIAAAAWPAAGLGILKIAEAMIADQPPNLVVAGFVAQSAVLYVPFFLLERSAAAVGARRTPVRIAYVLGVVLLVYIQGLGGLSNILSNVNEAQYGRLAGYLVLGALVQLVATLAVTDGCRSITEASEREAEHHNLLADQHSGGVEAGRAVPLNAIAQPRAEAVEEGPDAEPACDSLPAPTVKV